MSDKKELRKRYKKILGSLSEEERASYSRIICEKLSSLVKGKIFLSYSPIGKEVDVSRINELYLPAYPRVLKDHQMEARLQKNSRFLISRYGIAIPITVSSSIRRSWKSSSSPLWPFMKARSGWDMAAAIMTAI